MPKPSRISYIDTSAKPKPPTGPALLKAFAAGSGLAEADRVALVRLRAAREALEAYQAAAQALHDTLDALPSVVLWLGATVEVAEAGDAAAELRDTVRWSLERVQETCEEAVGLPGSDVIRRRVDADEAGDLHAFTQQAEELLTQARTVGVDGLASLADEVVSLVGGQLDQAITTVERERLKAWPHAPYART